MPRAASTRIAVGAEPVAVCRSTAVGGRRDEHEVGPAHRRAHAGAVQPPPPAPGTPRAPRRTPGRGRSPTSPCVRAAGGTAAWFVACTTSHPASAAGQRGPRGERPRRVERADRARDLDVRAPVRRRRGSAHLERDHLGRPASSRGERGEQLAHVRPDPARRGEPQLVDVERDLHGPHASTHAHPAGPTVAACAVPAARSSRSPAVSSRSLAVDVEHDRALDAEQDLVRGRDRGRP